VRRAIHHGSKGGPAQRVCLRDLAQCGVDLVEGLRVGCVVENVEHVGRFRVNGFGTEFVLVNRASASSFSISGSTMFLQILSTASLGASAFIYRRRRANRHPFMIRNASGSTG